MVKVLGIEMYVGNVKLLIGEFIDQIKNKTTHKKNKTKLTYKLKVNYIEFFF